MYYANCTCKLQYMPGKKILSLKARIWVGGRDKNGFLRAAREGLSTCAKFLILRRITKEIRNYKVSACFFKNTY